MNEARNNPNAQAKAEGEKTGFATEINDIAVMVKLAEIGIEGLKLLNEQEKKTADNDFVETLLKIGPGVIDKFKETAIFLYLRAKKAAEVREVKQND